LSKKAYISGPMTGFPDDNRGAFRAAASKLRELGFEVLSPDELDAAVPVSSKKWADYLRRDLTVLSVAEVLFALPGWRHSKGATLEMLIAGELGIPCYEFDGGLSIRTIPADELPRPAHPVLV
jgi:hypothetical protein